MAVVSHICLVFDVRRVDSDTTGFFLGRAVDLGVVGELCSTARGEDLGDGGRECGLAVVDVS